MNAPISLRVAERPRPYPTSEIFRESNLTETKEFFQGPPQIHGQTPAQDDVGNGILANAKRLFRQSASVAVMNHATLYLRDGSSILDVWPRSFRRLPSIGDFISIDSPECGILRGYKPQARITMIELEPGGRSRIYLEAEIRSTSATRTVVFLNESQIPRYWRRAVEAHLRQHLELPIFGWTRSNQAQPLIRVLATPVFTEDRLRQLRAGVRDIMATTEAAVR